MKIIQSPEFSRHVKRLHKNQKNDLDAAIKKIIEDPSIGELKKGDLNWVQVYKFKMVNQLILIAYHFHSDEVLLILIAIGSHENFYRSLKRT